MRRVTFYRNVLRHGLDEACILIDTLVFDTLHKKKPAVESYEALLDPDTIARELGHERLELLAVRARDLTCYAAVLWLLAPARRTENSGVVASTLLHKDLRDMSLGHRRSLARRARGDELTKLLSDTDSIVVSHLLENPNITEQQVLNLCARRPTMSSALENVIESPWIRRYRIKASLAQNPYLATKRATVLLPLLNRRDIRSVAHDATLSAVTREAAQHLDAMWSA